MSVWRASLLILLAILPGPALAQGSARSTAAAASPATAAASSPATSRPVPRYRCDQPVYTLHNVWSGDKVDHTFVIHNDGSAPLAILKIEAACGCFVAEDYPRTIPPGGQGRIRASLQTPRAARTVRKEMEVRTNDPANPRQILVMEGPLTPRIEVDPLLGANWGRLAPGDSLTRVVKLTNHFKRPMKLAIGPTDTHADFTVSLRETEAGQVAELTVTVRPDLPEGPHMGQVYLTTGFEEEPELMVPCSIFVPPPFEAIPIAFSVYQKEGDIDRQTLMLRWNGPAPMKILAARAPDPAIQTLLTAREPGRVYDLVVTLPPWSDAGSDEQSGGVADTSAHAVTRPAAAGSGAIHTRPAVSGRAAMPRVIEITLETDSAERPVITVPIRPRVLPSATTTRPR